MNRKSITANTALYVLLGIAGTGLLAIIICASVWISTSNSEIGLRNAITAKQRDNQSELDNMQKKIVQSGMVTREQSEQVVKLVRTTPQGAVLTAVHEAIPNLDQSTYRQLMNVVTSSRDAFTMRQKEILDLKREHDNIRTTFPGSFIVGGRPEIQVQIVTSDRAEAAFVSGKDNDVNLFQ